MYSPTNRVRIQTVGYLLGYPLSTIINSQISSFKIQENIKFQYFLEIPLDLITPCTRSGADCAGLGPTDVTAAVRSA